jgi:hypothetical protein
MKFNSLLIWTLLAAGLAGCGSDASNPDAGAAPRTLQRVGNAAAAAVSIAGYRDNYTMVKNQSTNEVTLTSKIDQSVAIYQNPGLIKFVDKWTSFEIDGAAGRVYRLYQAAFNRVPDLAGLGFWVHAHQTDAALPDIAKGFVSSEEFKGLYGQAPSHQQLVSTYYRNVLHRDGEKAGIDWWVAQMDGGGDAAGVLIGFSESAENKAALAAGMQNGFDYVPYNQGGPIVPEHSSYENKVAASNVLGTQPLPPEVAGGNAVAFADFFQDGSYSMVTHTLEYIPAWSMSEFGHIRFYQRDAQGHWIDRTSALLKNTQGCLHPRKAVVADFNGDGKPDVFFACHGFDREPFPGEQPHILLSQTDGSYQNKTLPVTCFCHAATALDSRGDGFADIVVTDNTVHQTPFFLVNNRDGSFSVDTTRLPAEFKYKGIFSVEAIDFDRRGVYDIWIGGNEPGATAGATTTEYDTVPRILKNDGKGNYPIRLAHDLTPVPDYGLPLDIVFDAGKIYLLRTNIGGGPNNYGLTFYTTAAVQVIDYPTGVSSLPYTHKGAYSNGMPWVNWLVPNNGKVVSMDAAYGITLP